MNNNDQCELELTGDISLELADHVSNSLNCHSFGGRIVCLSPTPEAYAVAPADVLATAAAIAAVLNFLLNLGSKLPWPKKKNSESDAIAALARELQKFQAHGFEVDTVEINDRGESSQRVLLRDVPDQLSIEIKRETRRRFSIRKKIAQSRDEARG